jgi:hypothetical protein
MNNRLQIFKREIERQIIRIKNNLNNELLERVYLYYDGYPLTGLLLF